MTELEQGTQESDAGRVAAAYARVHPADVLHQPRRRCIRAVVAPIRPQTLRNRRRIRPRPRIKVVLPSAAPMSVKRTPMSVSNVRRVACSTVSQASAFSKRVSDFNAELHPSIQDLELSKSRVTWLMPSDHWHAWPPRTYCDCVSSRPFSGSTPASNETARVRTGLWRSSRGSRRASSPCKQANKPTNYRRSTAECPQTKKGWRLGSP